MTNRIPKAAKRGRSVSTLFTGERLLEALRDQELVRGDGRLARRLAELGRVLPGLEKGETVYKAGEPVRGLFFLLQGRVQVVQDGAVLNELTADQHFGEFPILRSDPTYQVDVVVADDAVVYFVAADALQGLGKWRETVWFNMARALAHRLMRINAVFLPTNDVPRVFLGSSTEALDTARALERELRSCADIRVDLWVDGFPLMEYAAESLDRLSEYDFAVFVLAADDDVVSRDATYKGPRDNVLFEAGMAFGQLGRKRTFLLRPDEPEVKIPSDLHGINIDRYRSSNDEASLERIAQAIAQGIRDSGPRTRFRMRL